MKTILTLLFLCLSLLTVSSAGFAQTAPVLFAPDVVSTEMMETTATFAPDGKTLYFTSAKSLTPEVAFPKKKENFADAMKRIRDTNARSRNIWSVDLTPWLKELN